MSRAPQQSETVKSHFRGAGESNQFVRTEITSPIFRELQANTPIDGRFVRQSHLMTSNGQIRQSYFSPEVHHTPPGLRQSPLWAPEVSKIVMKTVQNGNKMSLDGMYGTPSFGHGSNLQPMISQEEHYRQID